MSKRNPSAKIAKHNHLELVTKDAFNGRCKLVDERCVTGEKNYNALKQEQNEIKTSVDEIKKALIGDDMQSGLIARFNKVELFMKISVALISILSTAAIGLGLKILFGV